MIKLTKLNGKTFVLNSELIEFIEETPDTIISTTSGKKIVVVETIDQVVEKVLQYKRKIYPFKELLINQDH
ncbi:flagellar FlbD family protein [Acetivibrio mesophilus]|uniref:Flagellar protein n=1 Tax=Acetivibrio mesophilus TaxID=2487273 RepID=A0A4Q0I8C2_9FIRM|nr:flagellar FlbD family protein [Acetivibrio mesophilus]ODM25671.1 flagellar protein [Clostridium sp. Bc-iso-3]RXE60257.1 flagellar protein [Acetivibrio mesophilus]HHV29874.1 flagellar FlbD family protein [Clostridium sp.]